MKKIETNFSTVLVAMSQLGRKSAVDVVDVEGEKYLDYSKFAVEVKEKIENSKARSCWAKGVRDYALDLFNEYIDSENAVKGYIPNFFAITEKDLLGGAKDWKQYSWGGCAFCYDGDIARALCTPSELKRTKSGKMPPNSQEDWLDVQARALYQAARLIFETIQTVHREYSA